MAQIDTDLNSRIDQHKDVCFPRETAVRLNACHHHISLWRNSDEP